MTEERMTPALETCPFEREERYIVVKRKHLSEQQERDLREWMRLRGIGIVECAVVENDWPEYETVWRMIEDRVSGRLASPALEPVAAMEPVAWLYEKNGSKLTYFDRQDCLGDPVQGWTETPLYAHPDARAHAEGYEAAVRDVVAWLRGWKGDDGVVARAIATCIERGEFKP
ncbi:MAG TPA: hypothetical protein VFM48_01810 [Aquabacterium sp.]|nr:hypothetical protein [Aquabacterium sp.]